MPHTRMVYDMAEHQWRAVLGRASVQQRVLVTELTGRITSHNGRMTELGHRASVHCARGCARCCSMIFFVSPAEVEVIVFHLLENPALLNLFLAKVREREVRRLSCRDVWRRCQAATLSDDPALSAWYAQDIGCAFQAAGACSIYPVRPLSCSLYNSIVPAEVCAVEPKSYETEEMRTIHGETRQWLAAMSAKRLPVSEFRLDVSYKVLERLMELTKETCPHMDAQDEKIP